MKRCPPVLCLASMFSASLCVCCAMPMKSRVLYPRSKKIIVDEKRNRYPSKQTRLPYADSSTKFK